VLVALGGVPVTNPSSLKRPQLLLVEDDRGVRDAIEDYLEDEGYSVLSANDGEQALSILEGLSDPCLVVLDVRMPVMDGVEFMRQFRARPWLKHHRLVLMSASELAPELTGAPGVVGLLQKPFELERLLTLVQAEVAALAPASSPH
jgi:CheY-like chemotaxis protein